MQLPKSIYEQHTQPMLSHINVGTGQDITISELVDAIVQVTGFLGKVTWNAEMPDGTPRKLMDVSRLESLGWKYRTKLIEGLEKSYQWFLENQSHFRS